MSQIFISYRREDARGWAPGVHRVLTRYFASENVFYDRRTIQGGDDWFAVIVDRISTADAVVVLIGPDWIGPDGGRINRLSDPADVVRREVELAVRSGRWIIPVLLEARPAPAASDIPPSLQPLLALHMTPMRSDIFDEDAERLLNLLIIQLHDPGQIRDSVRRQKFAWLIEELMKGFGGRADALERIVAFLENRDEPALLINAPAGFGKTSLLAKVIGAVQTPFAFHLFNSDFDADSVRETDFLASMVEQLMAWQGLREQVQATDLAWLKGRFASLLTTLPARDHIAVLDGLDEINGVWEVRPYVEMLRGKVRVLASARMGGPSNEAYGFPPASTYVLGGFSTEEVKDVLAAAGPRGASLAARPTAVAEVTRIAATQEPGLIGADPFVVRFIARDLESNELTIEKLSEVKSSGLTAYLNHWLDQITTSVEDDERPLLLLGLLASARAPLPIADLERLLPPAPNRVIHPRIDQTLRPVRRFVMTIRDAELTLVHRRLAEHLRHYLDVSQTRDRLIDDCLAWQTHHSPYAIRWLVFHLIDAERADDAWRLVTEEGPDGRSVWYAANPAANTTSADNDRLAWYLDDLTLLGETLVHLGQPLERIITLVLLQGSVAAISERVPIDLLDLMASLGGDMLQRAVTLALRRAKPGDRLRAIAAVLPHVDAPSLRRGLGAAAVATFANGDSPRARSEIFTCLAPHLSADLAQRAVDLILENISKPANVEAAAALAAQLPDAAATQVHADLWTAIHSAEYALDRVALLATYARLGLPDAEGAAGEAIGLVSAALEAQSSSESSERKLVSAIAELALVMNIPWEVIQRALSALDDDDQTRYLRSLLEAPDSVPVVPAVNHLLTLNPSEDRGRAFASALPHMTEEDAKTLAFGVSWDVLEFSWLVSGLPEVLRADAASTALNQILKETPSNHDQAKVLARLAPFLSDADRARAIQFMEASASMMPLVQANEEIARQVAAMLKITDAESGRSVEFEMSVGPVRADTLTLVARTVDSEAARAVIEHGLQAAHAIDDRLHGAVIVVDLASGCAPSEALRLQRAAIDLILGIEWDATRADGLGRIASRLSPEALDYALLAMTFEAPKAGQRAEAALLIARTSRSASEVSRLMDLLQEIEGEDGAVIVETVVADLSDDQVAFALDRVQSWEQTEAVSRGVAALAARIAPERAAELLVSRPWSLSAAEALLKRLSDGDRAEFAPSIFSSIMSDPSPASRALALAMLQRVRLPGLTDSNIREALEMTLSTIDAGSPPNMVASVALALPEDSPSRGMLIDLALRRRTSTNGDEWARAVAMLGASIAPTQVREHIETLKGLEPAHRSIALGGISAAMAQHRATIDARAGTIRLLAMMHDDGRQDLLSQLLAMRPLLSAQLSTQGHCVLADNILQIQRWFP